MLKKHTAAFLLSSLIFCSGLLAAVPERYVAGTHYTVLDTIVPTSEPKKIEVLGAFWYGCPHCYSFEPLLVDWVANAASDVEYVRFPAVFGSPMDAHGRIYFTAENLGVIDRVHDKVYESLVVERKRLQTESQIGDLFVEQGIAREDFLKSFNSFSVRTKLEQAKLRTRDYNLQGTPSIVVNGKYVVITGGSVRTQQEMLQVIDFLVQKERQGQESKAR